jgi:exodeoxyribonuclease III
MTRASILGWCLSAGLMGIAASAAGAESLRVMTFNIWVGGESGSQPLAQTKKVIEAARADVVGLQETHGESREGRPGNNAARALAEQLGWHYFDQDGEDRGVISRFKIVDQTPKKHGVAVELPSGERVWVFNAHFYHSPYQPYQLLKIPYGDAPFITTETEAIAEARKARGHEVKEFLEEINSVRREGTAIVVTGDFNEPSSLDWTERVAFDLKCPIAVRWPATAEILDAGFVDAYRVVHPDPLLSPGNTWTPITAEDDPSDRHDRIDFVMIGGAGAKVNAAEVVGEKAERADIVVTPYPSDHRAVVAEFEVD